MFDWKKLISQYDTNKDGQLAIEEVPTSLAWHIRKEIPQEVPGNMFPMRNLLKDYTNANKDGIITKTGKRLLDRERIGTGGQAVASPIAANGFIYTVNEAGTFAVLRAGDEMDIAAINKLGESVRSTPAIAGDTIYVRSAEHLWAFRKESDH